MLLNNSLGVVKNCYSEIENYQAPLRHLHESVLRTICGILVVDSLSSGGGKFR